MKQLIPWERCVTEDFSGFKQRVLNSEFQTAVYLETGNQPATQDSKIHYKLNFVHTRRDATNALFLISLTEPSVRQLSV